MSGVTGWEFRIVPRDGKWVLLAKHDDGRALGLTLSSMDEVFESINDLLKEQK
jgi:hypothetical protein